MQDKVGMISLGCAKNLVDAERMLGALQNAGYELTNQIEHADVLLVNTCGFILSAREESIAAILDAARFKQEGRCRALVVTGCLSQRHGQELVKELPEVDAFAPVRAASGIVQLIERVLAGERVVDDNDYCFADTERLPRILATPSHTAYLRLSDGCDNHCSYCAIPSIRGRLQSRPLGDIVDEAQQLAEQGVRELVLIAQDTTAYGHDLGEHQQLASLITHLGEVDVPWVRVMYAHPGHLTPAIIEAMAQSGNCCAYLDLPLQHASSRILSAMRRPSVAQHCQAIERLRKAIPQVALRTTFLVGFPGETAEDFNLLLAFIEDMQFDHVGAFAYSAEEGTAAANMKRPVPGRIAGERLHQVMSLQQKIAAAKNRRRIGQQLTVLVDSQSSSGVRLGRAEHQAPETDGWVSLQGGPVSTGSMIQVRIIGAGAYDLVGRPLVGG